tara:strand:+ start:690 stop:1319 length:630 start_codon:yes stop_codon:yes gene_type:complete
MAWDDVQSTGTDITAAEWNSMVTYIKSVIESDDTIDIGTFKISGVTILPTSTEFNYVAGVSSSIQTQIDSKLGDLIDDTTPQLGGVLALNSKGITEELTAGESLVNSDLCYLKEDGKMWKVDADAESTADTLLAIATATISGDATGTFLLYGIHTTSGLTAGDIQYVSTTEGEWTSTAPSGTGDIVRIIGYALDTTVLFFKPDNSYIEV